VINQEHGREEAHKKKELRAEILFSRLLEGMRGLLASESPRQRRELPPFMSIKRTYIRPLHTKVALCSLMRRQMHTKLEVQLHQHTLISAFFDALDAEAAEHIQALSFLHFLHNFGLDVEINAFNCMLSAHLGTSLEGELTKKGWMELMENNRNCKLLVQFPEFSPYSPRESVGNLLQAIEQDVIKSNHLFHRSTLWWEKLSTQHRGSLSIKATCAALSSQYSLNFKEVQQSVEGLFGKEQMITEQRFLAILYPSLVFESLRRIGERLYASWVKDDSQSFPTFVAALNRKTALELLVKK
jgi:hypothetical protein